MINNVNQNSDMAKHNKITYAPNVALLPKTYIGIPEQSLFKGYFPMGEEVLYSNNKNFGSDETRQQVANFNDDNTATIETYYRGDKGTEGTVDEILTVGYETTDYGSVRPKIQNIDFNIDGDIEYFKQGQIGDCVFLSSILSFSKTKKGEKILKESIVKNDDNSYSVTFKGIDTTVTVTQEELSNARLSEKYSNGDNTILLYEIAAQKAIYDFYDKIGVTEQDIFDYYTNSADEETIEKVEKYNKYNYLFDNLIFNNDELQEKTPIDSFQLQSFATLFGLPAAQHPLSGRTCNEDRMNEYLDNIDFDNTIVLLAFNKQDTIDSNNEAAFNILTDHKYTISEYDSENKTVTVVNPHNSSDTATLSISQLMYYEGEIQLCCLEQ